MVTFEIPSALRQELFRLAAAGVPHEVCGVLSGSIDGDRWRLSEILPCRNVDPTPLVAYMLDPEDQLAAIRRIEEMTGQDLLGFYHSHPHGPSQLSTVDAFRASWPNALYVLIDLSGSGQALRAWHYHGAAKGFEEVEVRSVPAPP